jgi:2-polyprenyl-3-methyl-5-hydroxy-6-metoxy-1,4-benzoquinol methylase
MYEYVKGLDSELDEYATLAFKIRDRDIKKEILAEIQDCKDKTFNFMEVLRSTQGKIPNAQIAKLNDLAYKGVKKRGMQKKLDERAMKNEQFYKKLTKQVKDVIKEFKVEDIQE